MTISSNDDHSEDTISIVTPFAALKISSAYHICNMYLNALETTIIMEKNTMNPDQTAPQGVG